jgi:hypothetical protein
MHVINFVYLNQVLETHKDNIRKQACCPAEIAVDKDVKNLDHHSFKIFVVFKNLGSSQSSDIVGNCLKTLTKDISFDRDIEVEFNIVGVLFANLKVHLYVV